MSKKNKPRRFRPIVHVISKPGEVFPGKIKRIKHKELKL